MVTIDLINILLFLAPCVLAVIAEPRTELFQRIDKTDKSVKGLIEEVHELRTTLNLKLDKIIETLSK